MRQVIAESGAIRERRFVVVLLGGFAAVALILAAVGLYGVMAYFVAERRREIAVRVALGATRPVVLKQVLGEAVRLLAVGLVTGAMAAQALTRLISSLLFGVRSTDVATHLAVFALLGTVALLASYLPARRAAAVDPMSVLRDNAGL
jgi:ABC-type antimicrobial peptide transport system permease subunit